MDDQQCSNCRYFDLTLRVVDNLEYDGQCRRFPPNVPNAQHDALWPTVNEQYWCGEYAPANPQTASDAAVTIARLVLLGDLTAAHALIDKLNEDRGK